MHLHSQLNTFNQACIYTRQLSLVSAAALTTVVDGFHAPELCLFFGKLNPLLDPRVIPSPLGSRETFIPLNRVCNPALVTLDDLLVLDHLIRFVLCCRRQTRGFLLFLSFLGSCRYHVVVFQVSISCVVDTILRIGYTVFGSRVEGVERGPLPARCYLLAYAHAECDVVT